MSLAEPYPGSLLKSIISNLDKIINDTKKTFTILHNVCLTLRLKVHSLETNITTNSIEWNELEHIFLLSAKSKNVKIIENCLNLYILIINNKIVPFCAIPSICGHLEEISITPPLTVRVLELACKTITTYCLTGSNLGKLLSMCLEQMSSKEESVRLAGFHASLQICEFLIDRLSAYKQPSQEYSEAIFCVVVVVRDVINMLLGDTPNWLVIQRVPHKCYLLQLLNQMIIEKNQVYQQMFDLHNILSTDIVEGLVNVVQRFNEFFDDGPHVQSPVKSTASSGAGLSTGAVSRRSISTFVELLKTIHYIISNHFGAAESACVKLLNTLCTLVNPSQCLWIRVCVLQIMQDILRDLKFTPFILTSEGKNMIVNITTYCLITMTTDIRNVTASTDCKSPHPKSGVETFWELFYQIQTKSRYHLWEDLDRIDTTTITNDYLTSYGTLILLTVPRMLYDYINRNESLTDETIGSIQPIISLLYPSLSCLLHRCVSYNVSVYDCLLESITLGLLVSQQIGIPTKDNLFLFCISSSSIPSTDLLLMNKSFQLKHSSILLALCDIVRYHSLMMNADFWCISWHALLENCVFFEWPASDVFHLYLQKCPNIAYPGICTILDRFFNFVELDSQFDFTSLLSKCRRNEKPSPLIVYDHFNSIFTTSSELSDINLCYFLDAHHDLIQKLTTSKKEAALDMFNKRAVILGRIFDLFVNNYTARIGVMFDTIFKTILLICKVSCKFTRAYAIQYYIFMLFCTISSPAADLYVSVYISGFSTLIEDSAADVHRYIISAIRLIIVDYKETLNHHWEPLLDCTSRLLGTPYSSDDTCAHSHYMNKQIILVIQQTFDQCLKYLHSPGIFRLLHLIEKYAKHADNLNDVLISTGYLITASDHFCDVIYPKVSPNESTAFWVEYFKVFFSISSSPRACIRKSSIQSLLNVLQVRATCLTFDIVKNLTQFTFIPLIELAAAKVTEILPTTYEPTPSLPTPMVYHHSRNTPQKQWMETYVLLVSGSSKLFLQAIQHFAVDDFYSHASASVFLSHFRDLILHPNIEISFHALFALSEFTSNFDRDCSNINVDVHFWKFLHHLILEYYQNLIRLFSINPTLPIVLQELALFVYIVSLTFPHVNTTITTEELDTWLNACSLLLDAIFTEPHWYIPRHTIPILNAYDDSKTTDFYNIFTTLIVTKRLSLQTNPNETLQHEFLTKLLTLLNTILMTDYRNSPKCEEMVLTEATAFYTSLLPNHANLIKLFPTFVLALESPIVQKYDFKLPNFWPLCIESLKNLTKPSIDLFFLHQLDTTYLEHLLHIFKSFLFNTHSQPTPSTRTLVDSHIDTDVIIFLTDVLVPGLTNHSDHLLTQVVILLLDGFVSVTNQSMSQQLSLDNLNLRHDFNDVCIESLITLSLGYFDPVYHPPNCHVSLLALNRLTNHCSNFILKLLQCSPDNQPPKLVVEVSCSLRATKAIFQRSSRIFTHMFDEDNGANSLVGIDFSRNLHLQLLTLFDVSIQMFTVNQSSLRILAQEAFREFRPILSYLFEFRDNKVV